MNQKTGYNASMANIPSQQCMHFVLYIITSIQSRVLFQMVQNYIYVYLINTNVKRLKREEFFL